MNRLKQFALLMFLVVILPLSVQGQGIVYHDIVLDTAGTPLPGVTVRVCTEPAVGTPCTPLASIFSDPGLASPKSNPFTADTLGNFAFAAASGLYHVQISGTGVSGTRDIPNILLNNPGASLAVVAPSLLTGVLNNFYYVDGQSGSGHYQMTNAGVAASLTACALTGGHIFVGYTPSPITVTTTLVIPTNCGFSGAGKVTPTSTLGTVFKAGASIDVMSVASGNAEGNRGGQIGDFTIDGNNQATRGLNLNLTVQRRFEGIRVINSMAGATLQNAQNNTFIDCDFENNTNVDPVNGAGVRISWGSANNLFLRGEIGANAPYGILFHANAGIDPNSSPAAGTNIPFANQFIKVNVEYPQTGQIAFIRMRIGRLNIFDGMDFGAAGAAGTFNVYQSNNDDGAVALNAFTNNSYVNGDSKVTVLHMQNDFKTRWIASNVEGSSKFAVMDDNSLLAMDGTSHIVSVTTFFTATGIKTQDQLILAEQLGAYQFDRPTTFGGDLQCLTDGGCSIGSVNRPNNVLVKNFLGVNGSAFSVGSSGNFTGAVGTMTQIRQVLAGQWAGTCSFAAATTCTIVYGNAYTSTPIVQLTPVNPGAVIFKLTATSNTGFTITADGATSVTVNWTATGNPN